MGGLLSGTQRSSISAGFDGSTDGSTLAALAPWQHAAGLPAVCSANLWPGCGLLMLHCINVAGFAFGKQLGSCQDSSKADDCSVVLLLQLAL